MKENCLEIGTIQAFLDGELQHAEIARVSAHIGDCTECALLLSIAEEESAIVFPALAREMDSLVPTHRLWNKINDSIETERRSRPFWQKAFESFSATFFSPSFAAAASLLLVIGVVAALWINKNATPAEQYVAAVRSTPAIEKVTAPPPASAPPSESSPAATVTRPVTRPSIVVERAAYRPSETRRQGTPAASGSPNVVTSPSPSGFMPGEESYVRTISSLNKTVAEQKDSILRPSERIAYERDMAVVNDTIAKMRSEVKKNPRNEAAKQVLYGSYQNKIDLLNSVAQKEELVVSMR